MKNYREIEVGKVFLKDLEEAFPFYEGIYKNKVSLGFEKHSEQFLEIKNLNETLKYLESKGASHVVITSDLENGYVISGSRFESNEVVNVSDSMLSAYIKENFKRTKGYVIGIMENEGVKFMQLLTVDLSARESTRFQIFPGEVLSAESYSHLDSLGIIPDVRSIRHCKDWSHLIQILKDEVAKMIICGKFFLRDNSGATNPIVKEFIQSLGNAFIRQHDGTFIAKYNSSNLKSNPKTNFITIDRFWSIHRSNSFSGVNLDSEVYKFIDWLYEKYIILNEVFVEKGKNQSDSKNYRIYSDLLSEWETSIKPSLDL